MPRHKRLNVPGCIYHVITRGIERGKIFLDDADYTEFLNRLESGLERTGCQCLAWSLMPNHIHLLIRTGENSLSDLMRRLLTGYAIYFNRRHKRHGYLYQNRYKSILCEEEVYFKELVRYIHLNPVRAKITVTPGLLNKYPWTGHSVVMGKRKNEWQNVDEVLIRFGDTKREAIKRYYKFILDGWGSPERDDLEGGGLKRSAGGWEGVRLLRKIKDPWRSDERILGSGNFVGDVLKATEEKMEKKALLASSGWDMEKLEKNILAYFNLQREDIIRKRRNDVASAAKAMFAYLGYEELRIPGKQLADYFNITRPGLSVLIQKGRKWMKENNVNLLS